MSCGNNVTIVETTSGPSPFDVTAGDAVDNVVSGPITVNQADELHFWSAGTVTITAAAGASGTTVNFVANQVNNGAGAPGVDPDDVNQAALYFDATNHFLYAWDIGEAAWKLLDTENNILQADLTADGNRVHDVAGFNLDFNDTGDIHFDQDVDSGSNFTIGSWTAGGGTVTEYANIDLTSQQSKTIITNSSDYGWLLQAVEDVAGTVRSEFRVNQGNTNWTHWNTSATKQAEIKFLEGQTYNIQSSSSSGYQFDSTTGKYRFTNIAQDDTETKFLVIDSSNELQWRAFSSIIPTDFSSLTEYDNDTAAGVGGVGSGEFWVTSAGNTIGLPRGVVMRKI